MILEIEVAVSIPAATQHLPRRFRTPPPQPPGVQLFFWSVSGFSALALAGSFSVSHYRLPDDLWGYAGWSMLVMIADLVPVRVWGRMEIAASLPLLLAAAFVFGPFAAGVMAFVASFDPREFRGEVRVSTAVFNRAQVCLSVLAAAYTFEALDGNLEAWPLILLVAALAVSADMAVNLTMVSLAQKFTHQLPVREVLGELFPRAGRDAAPIYGCLGLLGLFFAETYTLGGAWSVLSFIVPLVLARQALARAREADHKERQLRRTKKALLEASERVSAEVREERARIAGALHDDLLQSLQVVSLHAQVVREDLRSGRLLALEDDVAGLLRIAKDASSLTRETIRELRHTHVGSEGVSDTLALLLGQLESETEIQLEADLRPVVGDPEQQLVLYQVAKEALFNAIQHSGAKKVELSLHAEGTDARLLIADDGGGFDVRQVDTEAHFGLGLMRERVELGGGVLQILSERDQGTVVSVRLPLRLRDR